MPKWLPDYFLVHLILYLGRFLKLKSSLQQLTTKVLYFVLPIVCENHFQFQFSDQPQD